MPSPAPTNLDYTPPDGGWGWAVVFGSFMSIGFSYAFPKSLTIYYKEIQRYFLSSYSEIAWVSSIMLASMYAGGKGNLSPFLFLSWVQSMVYLLFFYSLCALFFKLREIQVIPFQCKECCTQTDKEEELVCGCLELTRPSPVCLQGP